MATPVSLRTRSSTPGSRGLLADITREIKLFHRNKEKLLLPGDEAEGFPISDLDENIDPIEHGKNKTPKVETDYRKPAVDHKEENNTNIRSPLSPMYNLVETMRHRLEQQFRGSLSREPTPKPQQIMDNKTSPGLAKLRNTPVKSLRERQLLLEHKHRKAKSRTNSVNVGGGISLWPEMDNMRLTPTEVWGLTAVCVVLSFVTTIMFFTVHRSLWDNLQQYSIKFKTFQKTSVLAWLVIPGNQADFDGNLLHYHSSFIQLMNDLDNTFSMTLSRTSVIYQFSVLLYCFGIFMLLYFLGENVFSKNKLTPQRIKIWVSLLVVFFVWTLLGLCLLVLAQKLEDSVETSVHQFSGHLSDLVYTDLDLTKYHNILLYWSTRCLPPTTHGTLSILGVLPVRDVAHYLQYYSLPVITALLTPIVKLVISLKNIYDTPLHS